MDRRYEAGAARGPRRPFPRPTCRPHQTEAFYVGNGLKTELVDVFVDGTTIQGLEQEPADQDGR
jgi:hypothetical protein